MSRAARRQEGRQQEREIREYVRTFPEQLTSVPPEEWLPLWRFRSAPPIEAWRSRRFTVQVFLEGGVTRLSVQRTDRQEGISWDELQQIKADVGRGGAWAVELFPPADRVVNVANMRHLWLLPGPPAFGWKRGAR